MSESYQSRERRDFLLRIKDARIGDSAAQYDIALRYANGVGTKKNLAEALLWAEAAAERGHSSAQYLLGSAYQQGLGTPPDTTKALTWYLRASEKGSDKAALKLAEAYAEPQATVAFHYAMEAAHRGLADAQFTIGNYLAKGFGTEKDVVQASAWYQLAATQGLALAQYALGRAYELGDGVDIDVEQAKHWYRDAAGQGLPSAQLALYKLDGVGWGRADDTQDTQSSSQRADSHERRVPDSRWIQYAAKGSMEDFYHLGLMFELGAGVEKSVKQARLWFEKAAERGHAGAMVALARMLPHAAASQAVYWYTKAAEWGQSDAQFALAQAFLHGRGVDKNVADALYWHVRAGKQGHAPSQFALFELFCDAPPDLTHALVLAAAQGGVERAQFLMGERCVKGEGGVQDGYQACQWYQLAADKGSSDAQCALAQCLEQGIGVKKDISQSFFWYEKAAAQGHARALWKLGELYASGVPHVNPDAKKAMVLCKKSANAGFAPAQATLGTLFAKANKYDRAIHWWNLAAQQNDLEALFNLSTVYRLGSGVEKDETKAFELLMTAAMHGLAAAQAGVGLAYATGIGAVLDTLEAAKWFILASENGDKAAVANKEKAKSLLSPKQWAEVVRRAQAS